MDNDGRMYLYREIYKTQTLVEDHAKRIRELTGGEHIEATVADHDAEDRATLAKYGVPTVPADKAISPGIQAVQQRLNKTADGRPRLFIFRNALVGMDARLEDAKLPTSTQDEWAGYAWPRSNDGKAVKEVPVQVNDHGLDSTRYAVMYADKGRIKMRVVTVESSL
jgi:phage terminase large subunit